MSKPDAEHFSSCSPFYLEELIAHIDLWPTQIAAKIGVSSRQLRRYRAGQCEIPYPIQFAVERLAGAGAGGKDNPNTMK